MNHTKKNINLTSKT